MPARKRAQCAVRIAGCDYENGPEHRNAPADARRPVTNVADQSIWTGDNLDILRGFVLVKEKILTSRSQTGSGDITFYGYKPNNPRLQAFMRANPQLKPTRVVPCCANALLRTGRPRRCLDCLNGLREFRGAGRPGARLGSIKGWPVADHATFWLDQPTNHRIYVAHLHCPDRDCPCIDNTSKSLNGCGIFVTDFGFFRSWHQPELDLRLVAWHPLVVSLNSGYEPPASSPRLRAEPLTATSAEWPSRPD